MDQECLFPKGNDRTYLNKIKKNLIGDYITISSKQLRDNKFEIKHYAGNVEYTTKDFCDKNKNSVNNELIYLLQQSNINLIQKIISKQKPATKSKINKKSITNRFKNQLNSLLKVISKTNTHYIRCLKPNDKNIPDYYEKNKILSQLRYAGVLEAVKVARAGYPIRIKINEFISKYKVLVKDIVDQPNKILENIINENEYQIGLTRVFLKKDAFNNLETLWINKLQNSAIKIQSYYRMIKVRRNYLNLLEKTIIISKNVRRFINRNKFIQIKNRLIKLQSFVRMISKLKLFKLKRKSISLIQKYCRIFINKKNEIRIKSIVNIQKNIRRFLCYQKYKHPIIKEIDDIVEIKKEIPVNEVQKEIIVPENKMEERLTKMEENFTKLFEKFSMMDKPEIIKEKDQKIEKLNDKVLEQEKIIEEDQKVKMEMGEKLQDLLLTLNRMREENQQLKDLYKMRLDKKKGGFFSWFGGN